MNPISDIPLWAFEWAGAFLGLTSAALLSLNVRASRFGWLPLLSNGAWIAYGDKVGAHGLVVMQIGFTLTSLMGVYRWLVAAKM